MTDIEKAMKQAHKFADEAIKKSSRRRVSEYFYRFKGYMGEPTVVSRWQLIHLVAFTFLFTTIVGAMYG